MFIEWMRSEWMNSTHMPLGLDAQTGRVGASQCRGWTDSLFPGRGQSWCRRSTWNDTGMAKFISFPSPMLPTADHHQLSCQKTTCVCILLRLKARTSQTWTQRSERVGPVLLLLYLHLKKKISSWERASLVSFAGIRIALPLNWKIFF